MFVTPQKVSEIGNSTVLALKNKVSAVPMGGSMLFVDGEHGDDLNAVINNGVAYKTIKAAKTNATSGSLIVVYPSLYGDYDLLKNQVDYLFLPGSKILINTDSVINIFDDKEDIITSNIYGSLVIEINCNTDIACDSKIIKINNNSSVNFDFKSGLINGFQNISVTAIKIIDGTVNVNAEKLNSGYIIQEVYGGNVSIKIGYIESEYGFISERGTVNIIVDEANISEVVVYSGGDGLGEYGAIVNAAIGKSIGGGIVFYLNNGKVKGSVGFVTGMLTSSGPNATMYISCDEIICNSGQTPLNVDGGNIFIDVKKITTNQQIACFGGGNINISVLDAKTSFDGVAIPISANANVTLKGRFETTTENPLFLNIVGNLTLDSAKLIVPITQSNSIVGNQTVISYNSFSNRPVANGTTINGSLVVESYVN